MFILHNKTSNTYSGHDDSGRMIAILTPEKLSHPIWKAAQLIETESQEAREFESESEIVAIEFARSKRKA